MAILFHVETGRNLKQLALLRGINVGGKNKLLMLDLAGMFTQAGCGSVQTIIQSGNVIFDARGALSAQLPSLIAAQILERYGYRTPVLTRTVQQLRKVVAANPFLKAGAPEETLHVMFLADEPGANEVAGLDPNRSPPDEFIVRGKEIYLRLPNGAARSKLTNAWFDAKLKTISTARNWNTVKRLLEIMERT
jgi:uncharacterized protein (DUF1697 family)